MTKIAGIIGYPLAHSVSPAMHNAAFRQAKIPAMYLPFEVNEFGFEASMQGFRAMPLLGFNVTIPYKQAVTSYLDLLDPLAKVIGAVNTVVVRQGKLIGYNTDGLGFWAALPDLWKKTIPGSTVLLLGAGGTARAIAKTLLDHKIERLLISNRTLRKAQQISKEISRWTPRVKCEVIAWNSKIFSRILPEVNWLINSTSSGLKNEDHLPLPNLKNGITIQVFDVMYHSSKTPLLRWAARHRLSALNGKEMLVQQGALAWTLWTGRPAPVAVMRRAVERALQLRVK